ncbi:MAG: Hsp20/alpha crystallin family protein [Ignavibacteria bacterium]|nr:Hsp20/alpha crystallin family protein [Ignavibacteria bacterium]
MRTRKFNPFWEVENMIRNLSNIIDSTIGKESYEQGEFTPSVDIWENDVYVNFEVELPGVRKEDINISIDENRILSISGTKRVSESLENKTCCRSERAFGNFHRAFQLTDELDTTKVNAKFENGVLTISVAKSEVKKPKSVQVEVK